MADWCANLPSCLEKAMLADGYTSAAVLAQCFRKEELLDHYFRGLLFVRQAIQLEGITEDNFLVSPVLGALRAVLEEAKLNAAGEDQERRSRQELKEVEALEKAKAEAKAAAKESAKDNNKKIAPGEKIRLEEQLGLRHPGTAGLSGKEYSATGRQFLQRLIKEKREGSYEVPRWEERCIIFDHFGS